MNIYFESAIKEATIAVNTAEGAPFGACIVKNKKIIASAHDTVLKENDATCHAEINAIRMASKQLSSYHLDSCVIYCTSEPCPMCLSAIHWSGIKQCYFIASRQLAANYGFDDAYLYNELIKPLSERNMSIIQVNYLSKKVANVFDEWKKKELPVC